MCNGKTISKGTPAEKHHTNRTRRVDLRAAQWKLCLSDAAVHEHGFEFSTLTHLFGMARIRKSYTHTSNTLRLRLYWDDDIRWSCAIFPHMNESTKYTGYKMRIIARAISQRIAMRYCDGPLFLPIKSTKADFWKNRTGKYVCAEVQRKV